MSTLASLEVKLIANMENLKAGIEKSQALMEKLADNIEKNSQKTVKSFMKMGAALLVFKKALDFGADLVKFGQDALDASMVFNRAMANVGSLIPGNKDRVLELKTAIQEMAVSSGKSTAELSSGMYEMIGAFGDGPDSIKRLQIATDLASAGLATTQESMSLIAAMTRAYGDTSAETAAKVADLATMTVNLGQTTLPELATALPRVTALSSALGVSFEEVNAVMATFTGVTGNANEVATQTRGLLQALAAPSEEMKTLFDQWGVATGAQAVEMMGLQGVIEQVNLRATELGAGGLQELVGSIEGQTIAMSMAGEMGTKFAENLDKMGMAAGATTKAIAEQNDGIAATTHQWNKYQAALEVFYQKVGQVLEPAFGVIFEAMKDGLVAVNEWIDGFPELDDKLKGFAENAVAYVRDVMVPAIAGAWPGIKEGFVMAWEAIQLFLKGDQDKFDTKMIQIGESLANAMLTGFELVFPKIEDAFSRLLDTLLVSIGAWAAEVPSKLFYGAKLDEWWERFKADFVSKSANVAPEVKTGLDAYLAQQMGQGNAAGGYITGPGSGTSDDIAAWLSNGEYVVNAKQTAKFRPVLEMINADKFAQGGIVGFASGGAVSSASSDVIDVESLNLATDMEAIKREMMAAITADSLATVAAMKNAVSVSINQDLAEATEASVAAMARWSTANENGLIAFANETEKTSEKVKSLGDTSNVAAKAQQDFSTSTSGMTETMKRFMENAADPIQNTTFKNEQLYTDFNDAVKKISGSFTANISALFPYLQDAQKQYDVANKSIWKLWNGASVALDMGAVKAQQESLLRNLDAQNKRAQREAEASIRVEELAANRLAMLESMYAIQGESEARKSATMGIVDGATRQMATNMQLAESFESTRSRIHESGESVNIGFQGMLSSMNDSVVGYVQKTQLAGDIIQQNAIMAMDAVAKQVDYTSGVIQAALNPFAATNSGTLPSGEAFLDPFKNHDPSRPRDGGQAPISVYVDGQKLFNIMQDRAGSYGASNVGTGFN